ncbi:NAD-dependent protein deacylase sirtuin-5, mitochondrial-like isoform X3 [Varroa destructor]|uniref:NAD-dependent protein deacylase n=1 Tax=Varroa destructor TaxID=109461 RepID=A0A7M7JAA0_VARDE|nr:NAD-dependent protein deacylase sirtuin-5, mitochondrial-like isoform X3 [Varroa destructor]
MSTNTSSFIDPDLMKGVEVFRNILKKARAIIALTGAGVSAESGVPTFRGSGGLWRTYQATDLATPQAFRKDPVLVWQFYHYRRELVFSKSPNPAHEALARFEKECKSSGKQFTLITQNVDGLHQRAGSENVIELHGSLYKVRCTECNVISDNHNSPVCAGLAKETTSLDELPHCGRPGCGGLLRPHIVWFGESLEPEVIEKARKALDNCDCCLVVGTSSVVYPAAMFAPELARRLVPVAEFNIQTTPETGNFQFVFQGPAVGSTGADTFE